MNIDNEMILTDNNGKEVKCKVVANFNLNDKHYIAYTDGTKDEEGKDELYVSGYEENNGEYNLREITSSFEWEQVDKYLDEYLFFEDDEL